MTSARHIRVRGVVQGVGFRPFVFRLAQRETLAGWVLNGEEGVRDSSGGRRARARCLRPLARARTPRGGADHRDRRRSRRARRARGFHDSARVDRRRQPTVRISPDLPVCEDCLAELFDPANPRYHYPYINCTNCGPRYSVVLKLPYDRRNTTMSAWPLDAFCAEQYGDPGRPPFSRAAGGVSGLRPAIISFKPATETVARGEDSIGRARGTADGRRNPRRKGHRRLSPGLRRAQRSGRACACASENIARKSRSR